MNDCLDNEIQVGDGVVVCHSGGTNSTLIMGVVTAVTDRSVKYRVHHAGQKTSYSMHPELGEERTVFVSHRIAVIEPDKE